jgi:chondroitin AC lyase
MQITRIVISFLFFFYITVYAVAYQHPGGMHPRAQIEFAKEKISQKEQPYYKAYLQLISHADAALLRENNNALPDFNVPGFYIEPEKHRANSKSLQSDAFDAYSCALAYQLSGKEKYAARSLDLLMAWANINSTYSNYDGSLVMAYSGTAMIIAAELLLAYEGWNENDKEKFLSWVKNVYRKASNEIRNRKNNWADWGRLGSILSAYLLDDKVEIEENIRLIRSDLFHKIATDGHMPEEVKREGNGIWYTYFSLAPVTAAGWVALQANGTDIFTWEKDGRSIKTALDYLFYHNQHPEEWKWFKNPRTGTPDSWPGNLLEAMHGIYGEEKYRNYVKDVQPLSYPTHHFAWTFPTLMKPLREFKNNADINLDLQVLRKKVIAELIETPVNEVEIKNLTRTIKKDGSWPDINYEDVSRTGFEHSRHLENLQELSRAYKKKGSKYSGDPKLKKVIDSALGFWLDNDFICENWWWNQIGTPGRMVNILLILDDELTERQKKKAAPIAGRANLNAWGARPGGDLIKIAGILGKYSLFTRDNKTLDEVVKTMAKEIKFASDRGTPSDVRGLQTDLSFHHRHDRVTSTLSYGLGYADAFADWAAKLAGTKYSFPDKAIALLVDFYLDGICQTMIYGKYPDPGAKNRSITRKGTLHPHNAELPENLLKATSYRKDELEEIIEIRKGNQKPDLSANRFFWNSEYFSHQRPGYFTSVRMYSSRNHSMEVPYNGEGLKNHHFADGSNFISRTGEEYFDIFPVWDWQKIPGTTVVQKPFLPSEDEIQKKGLTDFVGAVSDGKYGAATFDFKSPLDSLKAKKAWFFFDNEYVSLGSGIYSEAAYPVATTLNQCYLEQGVIINKANNISTLKMGNHHLKKVNWMLHDKIAYFFPSPTDVHLENQEARGSWYSINRQSDSPKEEIRKDVFKIWLDHGMNPQNSSYQYIVVPGIDLAEMEAYEKSLPVKILANSPEVQGVQHTGLDISQIVFYKPGKMKITESVDISIDSPGLVMVNSDKKLIKNITVADPSRNLNSIHLKVNSCIIGQGKDFVAVWNEANGFTDITIDLPKGENAGQSISIKVNPCLVGKNPEDSN